MPYGYGSANRGRGGPPGGGATSQGSGRDVGRREDRPTPTRDRHPPAPTVTTAVAPPSILSRQTPVTTAKGPPSILSRQTPVTTAVAPPSILSRGPSPGITHPFLRNKKIAQWNRNIPHMNRNWGNAAVQSIMNMPKYWKLPSGLRSLIESGAEIPFAHGTKTLDDYYDLARTGFQNIRSGWKVPTAHDLAEMFKRNPFKAEGVFGAVGDDALKSATKYAQGAMLRGSPFGKTTGKVFEGVIDPATAYINRGLSGNIQARVPAHIANKAFNLPGKVSTSIKALAEPGFHKIAKRALPGANIALGGASALGHLQKGNYGQAAMAGLSMVPGPVGWAGLGGELALGALQKYRQNQANGGLINFYKYGGFIG